jgi:peptidoglycan/LPS O-acetylase OafA/YrhL
MASPAELEIAAPYEPPTAAGRSAFRSYIDGLLDKKPSSGPTIAALDGVRGFAVLIVIVSHSLGLPGRGGIGVVLFFVLSGFLLSAIILQRLPTALGGSELRKYVVRRMARILPAYYLVVSLQAFFDGKDRGWWLRHLTFAQADLHFWSIPQEELFYLFLPLLFVAAGVMQWCPMRLSPVAAAGVLTIAVLAITPFHNVHLNGNGIIRPFTIDVFIQGFLLAHLYRLHAVRRALSRPVTRTLANAIAAAFVTALVVWSDSPRMSRPAVDHSSAAGAVCTLLLITALVPGSWSERLFSTRVLRVIGVLSFGLYLVHMFVLRMIGGWIPAALPRLVIVLIASLAAALALERVVERPFMRLGRRFNERLS